MAYGVGRVGDRSGERRWEAVCGFPEKIREMRLIGTALLRRDVEKEVFSPGNGVCEACMICVCDFSCKPCHFSHVCLLEAKKTEEVSFMPSTEGENVCAKHIIWRDGIQCPAKGFIKTENYPSGEMCPEDKGCGCILKDTVKMPGNHPPTKAKELGLSWGGHLPGTCCHQQY